MWPHHYRTSALCLLYSEVYVSFGGLLMRLKGDSACLHDLRPDSNIYLLLKRAANEPPGNR